MKTKIIEFIKTNNLIEVNDKIVLGFSGGPDSVFLLHILNEIRLEYKLELLAIHINHSIRKEAVKDELFSKKMAEKLGIKFKSYKIDVPNYAKENRLSLEDAGRQVRYGILKKEAIKLGNNSKIAVGHHKDDSVETVIMNFIRGSGTNGLIGIKEKNDNIIRPILCVAKSEILEYLNRKDINYVIDETNYENDYKRNQVRNDVIPYLVKNFNPNIVNTTWNMSNIIKEEQNFINDYIHNLDIIKKVGKAYFIKIEDMKKCHKAIQRNIIFEVYERLNGNRKDLSYFNVETILKLLEKSNASFEIKNYRIYNYDGKLFFRDKVEEVVNDRILVKIGKIIELEDYTIKVELVDNENIKFSRNVSYFNPEILELNLYFRKRKEGDSIKLDGFTKKIKDIFIDKKVDKYIRDKIPILASNKEIYWVLGIRRSSLYKINSELKKVVKISFERKKYE
ncbi:tRNA lysidine(34) synthetase TilS [Miniphocaeibacter massiliensis]|uniref:tRNA lysidine(34) synthetase TilS n=1 Tax=Miniphocaeibacter massiliensis TaxID=2041841 RepID=UPI000C08BD92|nr:tRNA lysidine(34) synthetase TilS [Miniphocaeibacter massiliensis]